jgi:hypothetical protein
MAKISFASIRKITIIKKKSNEQKGKVISWKEPNIKNTRVDINKR